ncbi:MAG TPA: hypothetical protein VEA69_11685 [Tepidisphaeraceae bacterium]|nr:hypothetical protein [Tepidisphaeraceae bacterium]
MPGTRLLNCRELKRQCELNGTSATVEHLSEALAAKHIRPDDFSLRDLAEAFMGVEWVNSLHPKAGKWSAALTEAVAYSDMSNITGQIIFSKINEGYEDPAFVFQKEIPVVQSDIQDMEKIPGMSRIGDEASVVLEGNAYPYVGFSEDYIEVAAKQKRGMIVQLTKELIFGDRTGLVLKRAKDAGYQAGLNLEKRCIDAFIDENGGAVSAALGGHRYHWKGTSYASFQASTPWVNVQTSNALVDWSDVEAALLRFAGITDPYTGEPINVMARDIVVTPQNMMTARRVLEATEIRTHAGGYATSGNLMDTSSINPLAGMGFRVISSQLLAARAATDTDWWLADVKNVVNRFVNWDITTEEAPANHPDAFNRDIVLQVKVTVKDAVSVVDPRYAVENRA